MTALPARLLADDELLNRLFAESNNFGLHEDVRALLAEAHNAIVEAAAALSVPESLEAVWRCEWIENGEVTWSQYHDKSDPMPEEWDDPPDRITAFAVTQQPGDGWRPIAEAPKDGTLILAATGDGRMMIYRGDILARNIEGPTPDHLSFPATHWMPLPAAPSAKGVA